MDYRILVINTGSTSTKGALFSGRAKDWECEITHSAEELKGCSSLEEQLLLRRETFEKALAGAEIGLSDLSAVAARGGTFGYAQGGAYLVEEKLLDACRHPLTNHPSNLSAILADDLAKRAGCRAYIYDAVCVNEVADVARFTGLKDVKRRPFSHVLNTRAVARDAAAAMGKTYEELNFIVAHLGGGISINVHEHGRIVDLLSDDEGPMSPERAGRLNGKSYVDLCFSGVFDKAAMMRRLKGMGGLVDHLGTSDLREVIRRIDAGDSAAASVLDAMGYQIAKGISELAAVLCGQVDRVILTGGAAHCLRLVDGIKKRVRFIAPVLIYPGSMEMEALAEGVARVLDGVEKPHIFEGRR